MCYNYTPFYYESLKKQALLIKTCRKVFAEVQLIYEWAPELIVHLLFNIQLLATADYSLIYIVYEDTISPGAGDEGPKTKHKRLVEPNKDYPAGPREMRFYRIRWPRPLSTAPT